MAAQIVHDHDIAGREGRYEELLDIVGEEPAVDRPVDHAGGVDPVMAQCGKEGQRLPFAEGSLGEKLIAPARPASDRGHVGLGPGLVDEDQPGGIKPPLILPPLLPSPGDLGPILLGGEQRFF